MNNAYTCGRKGPNYEINMNRREKSPLTFFAAASAYILTAPYLALAQTSENILTYQEPVSSFSFDFTSTLIKFIVATAFCIVILLIVKKFMRSSLNMSHNENMTIIDYHSLNRDKYIYLVDIYGIIYVIGVSSSSITKIAEITDRETIDRIKLNSDKNIRGKMFSEYLQKFMPAEKND